MSSTSNNYGGTKEEEMVDDFNSSVLEGVANPEERETLLGEATSASTSVSRSEFNFLMSEYMKLKKEYKTADV